MASRTHQHVIVYALPSTRSAALSGVYFDVRQVAELREVDAGMHASMVRQG